MKKANYILLTFLVLSCGSKTKFTEIEKEQAHLFIEALKLDNQSTDISNLGHAYTKVNPAGIQKMLVLKSEALSLAQQIPNSVLYKMHKTLPEEYAKYKTGLSLRINNLKNGSVLDEVKGSLLINE